MSDLEDGKYRILRAGISAPPPFPVGADEEGTTSPVVVGGKDNVWIATKLSNGNYTLTLERTGSCWFSHAGEHGVFVSLEPPPQEWTIQKQKDDTYSIEVPTGIWPGLYWHLANPLPETVVTLVRFDFPQEWRFIPA